MFPIAALLEVGNINLNRVELIWLPITTHLSEVRERDKTKKERERDSRDRKLRERERELILFLQLHPPTGLFSWMSFTESFCC